MAWQPTTEGIDERVDQRLRTEAGLGQPAQQLGLSRRRLMQLLVAGWRRAVGERAPTACPGADRSRTSAGGQAHATGPLFRLWHQQRNALGDDVRTGIPGA